MDHGTLADDALLSRVQELATDSRRTTVELLVLLLEVEDRKLHLERGHSTLFSYCVAELRFSEGEAGNRLTAARAARRFPVVLELLRSGEINLTTVRILGPHLTDGNHREVLDRARGLTRRQVEELVVSLAPRPIPVASLRQVPAPRPLASVPLSPPPRPVVTPLAPEVYRLGVTMTANARALWQRLRELVPGDEAVALERALAEAVASIEKRKLARTEAPRAARPTAPDSRHVPAGVRRDVSRRDGDRCAYVAPGGRRCEERRHLQFHHVKNWMTGGETTVANVQLRCRAHNQYEADRFYGPLRAQAMV